jgi:hypothetical protein
VLPTGPGEVTALGETPGGEVAALSHGATCGARSSEEPSRLNAFTEAGEPSASLDPARPSFDMGSKIVIDPKGRMLVAQLPPEFSEESGTLVRLHPNGDVDPSFGDGGGVRLTAGLEGLRAFTVDAKSRPILAGGTERIEVRRLRVNGKIDMGFGPKGRLTAKGARAEGVTLDARGRIYTVGTVRSSALKTGVGIQIARFLPGS